MNPKQGSSFSQEFEMSSISYSSSSSSSDCTPLQIRKVRELNGVNSKMSNLQDESADKFQVGTTTAVASATGNLTVTTGTLVANVEGSGAGLSAGTTPLTALDIDGGTDIGAALTGSDLIIVDDGAGGTNRKAALSRVVSLAGDDATALAIALG